MEQKQFNPKPAAIAEEISSNLPKQFHEAFARVVKAGMKIMFSKETHDDVIALITDNEGDIGNVLGTQIAGLMAILYEKSNKTMPAEIIIPAGTYLLAEGADFIEAATGEDIPPEVIAVAMQTMIDTLMKGAGIDPQQFYSVTEQALSQYKQEQPA